MCASCECYIVGDEARGERQQSLFRIEIISALLNVLSHVSDPWLRAPLSLATAYSGCNLPSYDNVSNFVVRFNLPGTRHARRFWLQFGQQVVTPAATAAAAAMKIISVKKEMLMCTIRTKYTT